MEDSNPDLEETKEESKRTQATRLWRVALGYFVLSAVLMIVPFHVIQVNGALKAYGFFMENFVYGTIMHAPSYTVVSVQCPVVLLPGHKGMANVDTYVPTVGMPVDNTLFEVATLTGFNKICVDGEMTSTSCQIKMPWLTWTGSVGYRFYIFHDMIYFPPHIYATCAVRTIPTLPILLILGTGIYRKRCLRT